jgi:hypothetical protein
MTESEALSTLPADAELSCTFGYESQGGFSAYYRTKAGVRYVIRNGSYLDSAPFCWTCDKVEERSRVQYNKPVEDTFLPV